LQGDPVQDGHVTAATIQHRNRKVLRTITPPLATDDDVLASKRRMRDVQSVNFDARAEVPLWARTIHQTLQQQQQTLQSVQQQVNALQQQVNALHQQMNTMEQESQKNLERMSRENLQERQRLMNRSRLITAAPIEMVIRLDDGQMPDQQNPAIWFPADQNKSVMPLIPNFPPCFSFMGKILTEH
jgi:uncharacterized phage infection (PIP) family protein YhgE